MNAFRFEILALSFLTTPPPFPAHTVPPNRRACARTWPLPECSARAPHEPCPWRQRCVLGGWGGVRALAAARGEWRRWGGRGGCLCKDVVELVDSYCGVAFSGRSLSLVGHKNGDNLPKSHQCAVQSLCALGGGRVASCSFDKKIRVWDVSLGKCVGTFEGHTQCVTSLCLLPGNRRLASASWTRRVWFGTYRRAAACCPFAATLALSMGWRCCCSAVCEHRGHLHRAARPPGACHGQRRRRCCQDGAGVCGITLALLRRRLLISVWRRPRICVAGRSSRTCRQASDFWSFF